MEESTKKKYEVTFWLKDEELEPAKGVLGKFGAEIIAERPLSKFTLSYPIKKTGMAYLANFTAAIEPANVAGLTAEMNAVPNVLRALLSVAVEHERPVSGLETGADGAPRRGMFGRRERKETAAPVDVLTNEALEKKIEEISQ